MPWKRFPIWWTNITSNNIGPTLELKRLKIFGSCWSTSSSHHNLKFEIKICIAVCLVFIILKTPFWKLCMYLKYNYFRTLLRTKVFGYSMKLIFFHPICYTVANIVITVAICNKIIAFYNNVARLLKIVAF